MTITFTPNTDAQDVPEVNMANGRAAKILDLLGFPPEQMWEGDDIPAEDFLGRVLLALALLNVTTDDEHGTPAATDERWIANGIDCGTRANYFYDQLRELQEVAECAKSVGAAVVWL